MRSTPRAYVCLYTIRGDYVPSGPLPPLLVYAPVVAGLHNSQGRSSVGTTREAPPLRHSARERATRATDAPMGFAVATRLGNVDATFRLREGRPDVRSRPFMTRHLRAGATGCSREYSSSLSELVASRSNMNNISLNRNSFIRGEVQFLRGRKIMFLPAKEAVNWAAGWGVTAH